MGLFSKSRAAPTVGCFGKIPIRGDFISHGLPRDLQSVLETWIRAGLQRAKASPGWRDAYMSSPIWQFAAAPDFFGEKAWCGVMMPSVDTIGRVFPLVIAIQREAINVEILMRAQGLAQLVLAEKFADVSAWEAEVSALSNRGVDEGPERLCAPNTGATFRAINASGHIDAKLRGAGVYPELYCRLIGVSDLATDAEVSLL